MSYKRYHTISKQMATRASYAISVPGKHGPPTDFSNKALKNAEKSAKGISIILDCLRSIVDRWNERAANNAFDKIDKTLLPGEKRTVVVRASGGEAVVHVNGSGDGVIPRIDQPRSDEFFRVLTGTIEKFSKGVREKMEKDLVAGKYDKNTLPADANFDRAYRNSRERAQEANSGGNSGNPSGESPRGDFNYRGGEREVMWA